MFKGCFDICFYKIEFYYIFFFLTAVIIRIIKPTAANEYPIMKKYIVKTESAPAISNIPLNKLPDARRAMPELYML